MNDAGSAVARRVDVLVIGGGAAGLAAAIFAARAEPRLRVHCVDGARRVGAKILVSGGSRCNVTNRDVTERDFSGGSPAAIRRVLRAFPAERARAFFADLGVPLHEEEGGKFFPDSHRSRTILEALLTALDHAGATLGTGERVGDLQTTPGGFRATTTRHSYLARRVVLATGGRSLPKSGSDGFGYELARSLGHGHVETTPALAPLVLNGVWHTELTGVSHPASITLRAQGMAPRTLTGELLWTHFGISGPLALNASRHWLRARLEGRAPRCAVGVCLGETFETMEAWLLARQSERPKAQLLTALAERVPASIAAAWTQAAGVDGQVTLSHLARDDRRRLVHLLIEREIEVADSRGYAHAEVTAGGVPLDEVDPSTMESRRCRGLHLVGEVLDVDGRLGGFNFQWAWSSGWVAGRAVARLLTADAEPLPPRPAEV